MFQIMCDIDKMVEDDKENIAPTVTGGLFSSYSSSITAKIGEYFPVYFNRKRRRDSSDDTDQEVIPENCNEKRQKTSSTLIKSIQLLSKIPIFSMSRPGSDMDCDKDHQCIQYLDYMSQRESFD